jgi:D-alanyl-D-alanine carboxypeptidase (penicillin-binding protein 5/6)
MNKVRMMMLQGLALVTIAAFGWKNANAESLTLPAPAAVTKPAPAAATPTPPPVDGKAYLLVDPDSGQILAQQNAHQRLAPASLTKIMTFYVIANALKSGQIKMDDQVHISEKAWKMTGSRMFIKVGQVITVKDLIQGIITVSGNDACVAMAEHVAGSEESFAQLMNQQAKALGMNESHFTDSTGMPDPNHYTTANDMAILSAGLIRNFPDLYPLFKEKWFTYGGIRQPNRNRLLWRDPSMDGIKTGHTEEAGFCLVASAKQNNMRLISVLMGAPSDSARATSSEQLLRYGFRFFTTKTVLNAGEKIDTVRTWKGAEKYVAVGPAKDLILTLPTTQLAQLEKKVEVSPELTAPVQKGQVLGKLILTINQRKVAEAELVALSDNPKGGVWVRLTDMVKYRMHRWFGGGEASKV